MMKTADKIATGIFWLTFGLVAFALGLVALIAGVQSLFLHPAPEWVGFGIGALIGGFLIGLVIYGVYRSFWGHEQQDERNVPKRASFRVAAS
jgi:uncharacterized membrane-anchored protein